jgi:cytochrome c oxidase subunit III
VINVERKNHKNQHPMQDNEPKYSLNIEPAQIVMTLILFGLAVMFLTCTVAYTYTRIEHGLSPLKLPLIFVVNTVILIGSSITLRSAQNAYLRDETDRYKTQLLHTLLLSFLFLAAQLYGWTALFSENILPKSGNAAAYLYLISGLHFAHVIAGLPFLAVFYLDARKKMIEPVSVLIYFSDPAKRMKLRLITWYWHFLDGLWIYLVLFFVVNSLVR